MSINFAYSGTFHMSRNRGTESAYTLLNGEALRNVPEYARLVDIENTNVNAALNGAKEPKEALDDIAKEQQSVLDSSGRKGGGGL